MGLRGEGHRQLAVQCNQGSEAFLSACVRAGITAHVVPARCLACCIHLQPPLLS